MSRLALIAHASPTVEAAYLDALAPYGFSKVVAFTSSFKGMSSAYVQLAQSLKKDGRILPSLIGRYAPGEWEKVALITWSAGYGLAREMLNIAEDVAQLDMLVMLDSLHSGSSAAEKEIQLAPFVRFAQLARQGRKVFFLGHSDVPTSGYESTTKTAHNLVARVGGVSGKFFVRAYDTVSGRTVKDYEKEHMNAVRLWGPEAAMEAAAMIDQELAPDTEPSRPPPPPDPFVSAFLAAAAEDLNTSPKEESFNAGTWLVTNILAPAGLAAGSAYCAATVTRWLRIAADSTGLPMPIEGSNGAQNLKAQFVAAGRWVEAMDIEAEDIVPGLIPVWERSKPGRPDTNWWGHTAACIGIAHKESFGCIEGNSDRVVDEVTGKIYAICQTERKLSDRSLPIGKGKLLGFGWPGSLDTMPKRRVA
jgi:hypothetical protein